MRNLFFMLIFFWVSSVSAQNIIVYSVIGSVTECKNNVRNKVLPKTKLSVTSHIVMEASSRIVMLDEINKEMYTIKGAADGKIDQLLTNNNVLRKKLTPQYFSLLMNKLSSTVSRNTYMQSAATSFRDTEELMEKFDSLKQEKDCIR